MPEFYKNLERIEQLITNHMTIRNLDEGMIVVNDCWIDTNQQLEMLTPDFFTGTAAQNPTIQAYQTLFRKIGILPVGISSIPIIRDIPLRMHTADPQAKTQQKLFAEFLEQNILANQWSMLFPSEYNEFRLTIMQHLKQEPINKKRILLDPEGQPLTSGGYDVGLYLIHGLQLWLKIPVSEAEEDISAAIDESLSDTTNTNLIVNFLKPKLLKKDKIAFNVRGISKPLNTRKEIQNTDLGGGHQHFLLLDRNTQTIYAINNTRNATDEDPRAFTEQIKMFLHALGDTSNYKFEFIQGKSRQPDAQSFLMQVCSISQFCHYAALLSGASVHEIKDIIPAKISTLMYLLQYAYTHRHQALYDFLNQLVIQINEQLEPNDPIIEPESKEKLIKSPQHPEQVDDTQYPESKISYVKKSLTEHVLLQVIHRLEQGSISYNPYWFNSQKKLNRIIDCLFDALKAQENIDALLESPESALSKAINSHRLPKFSFFNLCQDSSEVKSRKIVNHVTI